MISKGAMYNKVVMSTVIFVIGTMMLFRTNRRKALVYLNTFNIDEDTAGTLHTYTHTQKNVI